MVKLLIAKNWKDYELLDSGDGFKLERWEEYLTVRPDPRAIWKKVQPTLWESAGGIFTDNSWKFETPPPNPWIVSCGNIRFVLKPTEFKHTGVFPEQAINWEFISSKCKVLSAKGLQPKVLNLFAYTGGSTMAAALAGAHVTHVDASRPAMMWASENAKLSRVAKDRIRWIQDDVMKFVRREINRGIKYDGIIMDPPRFGRGMKGEVWKLLEDLPGLVSACKQILSPTPLFVLINAYTADMSSLVLRYMLEDMTGELGGETESGELGLKQANSERILPAGIFARWQSL